MNTYPKEFYDPLAIALDGARLQDFVDELLAGYNRLDVTGFSFNEDLLSDFTYEQVQKQLNMDVMASYVDLDSPAIPVGVEGDVIATGRIPRMKAVEYYNEDKLRKLYLFENRRDVNRADVINRAGVGVAEIIMRLVSRHTNSLSYQRDQIVSAGAFELTDTNNPNGIKNVKFANHVPAANKTTLTGNYKWWTDHTLGTEGSNADPIGDMVKIVKIARKKGVRGHFEMNDSYLDAFLGHSKVKEAIASRLYPLAESGSAVIANVGLMGRAQLLSELAIILDSPIVPRDGQARVEKWDNANKKLSYTDMDTFNRDVVVFVPDGNIGEILTVEPILLAGGEYAYAFGGKLAITIGKDFVKKCMSYNSEMTTLAVPNVPQYMWYIFPDEA